MDDKETMQDIRDRLTKIEVLLESMSNTTKLQLENLEDKIKVANHRIDDLEKNNTWLWRTIVGTVIGGAIALLFK